MQTAIYVYAALCSCSTNVSSKTYHYACSTEETSSLFSNSKANTSELLRNLK